MRKRREKETKLVYIRKRVKTPFPTNYLPTIPLKISAILRYYEFQRNVRRAEREQRNERDLEVSQYAVLTEYLEEEIEHARENLIKTKGKSPSVLLFKINPRFDAVLGRVINYISTQDNVEMVKTNRWYEKIHENPIPRLIVVYVSIN